MDITSFFYVASQIISAVLAATCLYVAIRFYIEKEVIAFWRALALCFIFTLILVAVILLNLPFINYSVAGLFSLFLVVLITPFRFKEIEIGSIPINRFDERDIMFSRAELKEGSQLFKAYYKLHPDKKILDDKFRENPGLLSPHSHFYHKKSFALASENFEKVALLHQYVDIATKDTQKPYNSVEISSHLKSLAKSLGALNVGIVKTKPYHFYSYKGRGKTYGEPIAYKGHYAIAFTVEMNHAMVSAAPKASIVVESSKQYLNSGNIAIQIAKEIREMGFEARAHIDGNYQLICPLVARDAGLGEIGRMGLLMTPKKGPRVRIAVVTTNLKLHEDSYIRNIASLDFCRICKKCALCCPGKSIPFGNPSKENGISRWKINSESCFTYWSFAGTDCGRCMAVCPFSHPDNLLHNSIRWGINKSVVFRHIAVYADNFFYGKRPKPKPLPKTLE